METRGSLVAEVAAALSAAGFGEPHRHAAGAGCLALAISRTDLFGHPDQAVDEQQIILHQAMLGRMVEREPI